MPIDSSGEENVLRAVSHCLQDLKRTGHMMILLLTDEQGDDVGIRYECAPGGKRSPRGDARALERAAAACRSRGASVFVLGVETLLQYPGQGIAIESADVTMRGYQDIGLAACGMELPAPMDFCGIAQTRVLSGYGAYSLSMLARKTKGTFFIISDAASPYEPNRMRAYQPEWCTPGEYDRRNRTNRLRRTLSDVVAELPHSPEANGIFSARGEWSEQRSAWRQNGRTISSHLRLCERDIKRLVELKGESDQEKHARKRWEANYDLTLAQLYKMKAMLLQHQQAFAELLRRRPAPATARPDGAVPVYSVWPVGSGGKSDKLSNDRSVRKAVEKARRALEMVVRKHQGTPWAASAQADLNSIMPVRAYASWYVATPKAAAGKRTTNVGM